MKKTLLKLKPSPWIINQVEIVQKRKKINILDFASGGGRHSINLASNRRVITAIDKDRSKLELYKNIKNINPICFDLERNDKWPLEKESFDVIIVTNYLYRPRIRELASFLKIGGFLFYETFAVGNEKYGKPSNPDYLLKHMELLKTFKNDFETMYYFQGKTIENEVAIIQRCSLKKRPLK